MKQPKSSTEPLQTNLAVQLLTAGTAACIADFITFPLDTAKVRLQVSSNYFRFYFVMNHSLLFIYSLFELDSFQ